MDVSLKQLEIYRAVVVAGSITKASQRIGLSQPSISQQLARLEETLDAQLIIRNRTGQITMTPAGEFWFKSAEELLGRMSAISSEHEQYFALSNLSLKLGVTPALRGRFTATAARIAQQETRFVKFDLIYAMNSSELVEMLRLHQINFAIVAEEAILGDMSSFAVSRLYEDQIVWAVPSSVSEQKIREALAAEAHDPAVDPVLKRYVEIDACVPTRPASDDWYRNALPSAMAAFSAQTFASSLEFVAEGLGTCHVPVSLLPNLGATTRSKLRFYVLPNMKRRVVLVMRKHLLTHPCYARIFNGLTEFCRTEYAPEMEESGLVPFEHLTRSPVVAADVVTPITSMAKTGTG